MTDVLLAAALPLSQPRTQTGPHPSLDGSSAVGLCDKCGGTSESGSAAAATGHEQPAPSGTLSVTNIASTIAPDPTGAPAYYRRLTPVPVITAPAFSIVLDTTKADPLDPNWDDNALFRIDRGFVDYNANGSVDRPETDPVVPGYEQFLTVNQPIYGTASATGQYAQNLATSQLSDGYHYITAAAFRHREPGTDPIIREFRQTIYIDRLPPAVQWTDAGIPITTPSYEARVQLLDRTTSRVHFFWDLDAQTDPVPLCNAVNQGTRYDRFEWRRLLTNLTPGPHSLTIVAFEDSGRAGVTRYAAFVDTCYANCDRSTVPPVLNVTDFVCFLNKFAALDPYTNCDASTVPPVLNVNDFICFQTRFAAGCP